MSGPEQSPVFHRRDALPRVRQPSSPWTIAAGLGGAFVLGLMVYGSLSQARETRAAAPRPVRLAEAAPPAPMASQPPPAPPTLVAPPPAPEALPEPPAAAATAEADRLRAPAVVVELGDAAPAGVAAPRPAAAAGGAPARAEDTLTPEERFAARVSGTGVETVRATRLRDVSRTAPQGTVIPAVLETALNSDLPGSVRAMVSRDVRGFDGRLVLIPRGSKLIGQYKSALAVGQTRAFVIWSRIITPEGVTIDLDSPAADRLGRGGLDGETDSHFLRRFGAAILLSVLDAGAAAAVNGGSGGNTFVIGSPAQANQVAAIALQKQIDIAPTIQVRQGAPLTVFVARDLDFSGVAP